jgi:aryl-alcohol dehydrogenase-like predicted oxidoreductase
MERRHIGALEVGVVGLGCNNFGMRIAADEAKAVVDAALEVGVDYVDTAESYGNGQSEEFLGAAVAGRRDQVLIATKWGGRGGGEHPGSPAAVRAALEGSLTRLGTDHIDHYQLHRPDPGTPIADTLGVLAELRAEGKVREIGCSNFSAEQLDEAATVATELGIAPFASVQNHYSLLTRDPERNGVLEACARDGVGFVPYFPLESGVLTGKYRAGEPPPVGTRLAAWGDAASSFIEGDRLERVATLTEWAAERGHTILELAMSWLVANPQVATVISGATSPDQIRSNVAAADWTLTAEDLADLDVVLGG